MWLPIALLVLVGMLLALMPWRRPHPNHVFIFSLCERLTGSRSGDDLIRLSLDCNPPLTKARYNQSARRAVR